MEIVHYVLIGLAIVAVATPTAIFRMAKKPSFPKDSGKKDVLGIDCRDYTSFIIIVVVSVLFVGGMWLAQYFLGLFVIPSKVYWAVLASFGMYAIPDLFCRDEWKTGPVKLAIFLLVIGGPVLVLAVVIMTLIQGQWAPGP